MKTKRKIAFFVALMSLFYCLSFMQDTYAKYLSSATATTNLTIARWNILVNNQDIANNSNFSETISPVFAGSANIASGVIAPTAEGYFEITINANNTDVSFNYTISIDTSDCSIEDLEITKYVVDNTEYNYIGDVVGSILLSDQTRSVTYRFYVKWNDNFQGEQMDNAEDTEVAYDGTSAFDVSVNVIQAH